VPRDAIGQMITFAAVFDADATYAKHVWVRARRGDTLRSIAARNGRPDLAATVLALNRGRDVLPHPKRKPHHTAPPIPKLHTTTEKLRTGARIELPGTMKAGQSLSVHAGDEPPSVKAGYAKYDVVGVSGRVGINRFLGYDPIAIDIPIQFENYSAQAGGSIEQSIQTLERFAGRGDYPGAAFGPPAVLSITASDAQGHVVPLIPPDLQWSIQHQHAPLFRISDISWGAGALRTTDGYRVRQAATVTVTQYTPLVFSVRSVAQRTLAIPPKGKH
jgi:hypothetical protein